MRRRIAALLGATLAASALALVAPVSPASADTNVCAGTGTATTSPIFYPVAVQTSGTTATVTALAPARGTFSITFGATGACLPGPKGLSATGQLAGWCGHSSGSGVTGQGHRFAWVSAASVLILTGEVTGVVNAIPNPLITGNSCLTGAFAFQVTGAVLLHHCVVKNKADTLVAIPVPATHQLVGGVLHVTTQPADYHVWTKVCIGV